jgi:hypothetical protein
MGVNGVRDIVGFWKGTHRGVRKRGLAGLAVLGAAVIAGLFAAWGTSPGETGGISAADIVALRFPADWTGDEATTGAAPAAPATFTLASASDTRLDTGLLFSPYQIYPGAPATAAPAPQPIPVASAASELKQDLRQESAQDIKPQRKGETKPVVVATRSIERKPAPRARKDSGELFNDAQLASIKSRLKLSEYQEQYWPPVENALRAIGHAMAQGTPPSRTTAMGYASETRLAQIDPESSEVLQLKSAAFPLIMSMNDDQKREVRMLAQVMGLQQVAASF